MVARVPELKEKWEMRVFDLWYDEAFNTISPEERALFMNGPIHPTKAGYRQWWCSGMERQLLQEKYVMPIGSPMGIFVTSSRNA